MENLKLFPLLLADPILEYDGNRPNFYIFNSANNRGYKLDGYAANLCHRFNGSKSLEEVIREFESEMNIEKNYFNAEISALIADLKNNSLIEFHQTAKAN